MNVPLLFVYGTLRPGFDGPMARWLCGASRHAGAGWIGGTLYRISDYPGLVPDGGGRVAGDLFELSDPEAQLARLDAYEECGPGFPEPQEYRRELLTVGMGDGLVRAWVYVYARDTAGLAPLAGGDFLMLGAGRTG